MWREKIDKYSLGILIGLLLPAAFGYAYVESYHLWGALRALNFEAGSMLSKMLLLAAFPDLAFLFVFYELDTWKLSKGVLIGSFPYVIAAVVVAI